MRNVPVFGLLVFVIALAVAGALQAADNITDSAHEVATATFPRTIATSFGLLTIAQVDTLGGLTSQDLAGVTHGIQNLVMPNEVQIEVSLQLVNRSDGFMTYGPEQFSLIGVCTAKGSKPVSGTLQTGSLPAHATIDAELNFVAPRTNQQLWLEYRDPMTAERTLIAIGPADPNAGSSPSEVPEEHAHVD